MIVSAVKNTREITAQYLETVFEKIFPTCSRHWTIVIFILYPRNEVLYNNIEKFRRGRGLYFQLQADHAPAFSDSVLI